MQNSLIIREVTKEDISALIRINKQSHQESYTYFMKENFFDDEWYRNAWNEQFKPDNYKKKIWIAEMDNEAIGFCSASLAQYHPKGYTGCLDTLFLLDKYKGLGIGRQLFEIGANYLLNTLNLEGFFIIIQEQHVKVHTFYEKMGGQRLDFKKYTAFKQDLATTYISYGWMKETSND